MTVEKNTSIEAVTELNKIKAGLLSSPKGNMDIEKKINSSIYVFSSQVLPHQSLRIESTYEELGSLVDEYLHMLSSKYNLAVLITIGFGCQVEAYRRVKRLCENYCDFSIVVPGGTQKSSIEFYISFYKAFEGEKYDIDFFTRYCS